MKKLFGTLVAAFALVAFLPADSHAVITYVTGSNTVSIPGLTGFATTGSDMDGLAVTVLFSDGFTETLLWGDTGPSAGGVFGTLWTLTLSGDTFGAPWEFSNLTDNLTVQKLTLDGLSALTVFDRTEPSFGTDGSAQGIDWDCLTAGVCDTATVTYDYQVGIGAAAPVGDLWQTVEIDFGPDGVRGDFSFVQDTDNDSRFIQTPEPGTLALLGLGLLATGLLRRRND